jgi:hypothetical protein
MRAPPTSKLPDYGEKIQRNFEGDAERTYARVSEMNDTHPNQCLKNYLDPAILRLSLHIESGVNALRESSEGCSHTCVGVTELTSWLSIVSAQSIYFDLKACILILGLAIIAPQPRRYEAL